MDDDETASGSARSDEVCIRLPRRALVLLVGPSGSGKTTFARRHCPPTAILSSDAFRALVADDENDQSATRDAFEALHLVAERRLRRGRLTVVDATNLHRAARAPLLALAAARRVPVFAVAFDLGASLVIARSARRTDRRLPPDALSRQLRAMPDAIAGLRAEGVMTYVLGSPDQVEAARIEWTAGSPDPRRAAQDPPARSDGGPHREPGGVADRRDDEGPFDIVGDVHGCADELRELLGRLGYEVERADPERLDGGADGGDGERAERRGGAIRIGSPHGRRLVFLGDLVDRGPATPEVLRLVGAGVASGHALAVLGNHDWKLLRWLWGRRVQVSHGLAESIAQLDDEPAGFRDEVRRLLEALPTQILLDRGRLVVAHAGLPARLQGEGSQRAREFAMYGETTGEIDEFGLPVRINWSKRYAGPAAVVYGHTPVREPEWQNETIDVDTGCVFGERLTALRWPERELVSVPAVQVYYATPRPLLERVDRREYLGGRPE